MMGEEGKSDNFDPYLRFSLPHRNRYTNFRGKNLGGRGREEASTVNSDVFLVFF